MKNVLSMAVVTLLLAVPMASVQAQDNSQMALARAQAMLRQVSGEKAALEARIAQLTQELESARNDLLVQTDKAKRREEKLLSTLDEWKMQYQVQRDKLQQTTVSLRSTAVEREAFSSKLSVQVENYKTCYQHNHDLVALNQELLLLYKDKGAWATLKQSEPVTGFGKVEIENLVQTYQHQIEDHDLNLNQHLLSAEAH